jgi:hypothetical protein
MPMGAEAVLAKLAISIPDMAALQVLTRQGLRFDASLIPALRLAAGQDVLFRILEGDGQYAAIGRLARIEADAGRQVSVWFDAIRWLNEQTPYFPEEVSAPSISILDDDTFDAVSLAGSVARREGDEAPAHFLGRAIEPIGTLDAIARTVLGEVDYRCAVTGEPLDAEAANGPQIFVLRPIDAGGTAHVNNCLALSPAAFAAFEQGHLTARDDFGLVADLGRIDPELLEAINPLGRLTVSDNSPLQPATENLAYHRRMVFRLG